MRAPFDRRKVHFVCRGAALLCSSVVIVLGPITRVFVCLFVCILYFISVPLIYIYIWAYLRCALKVAASISAQLCVNVLYCLEKYEIEKDFRLQRKHAHIIYCVFFLCAVFCLFVPVELMMVANGSFRAF